MQMGAVPNAQPRHHTVIWQRRHAFCHHRQVQIVTLVSMQPIHDDKKSQIYRYRRRLVWTSPYLATRHSFHFQIHIST